MLCVFLRGSQNCFFYVATWLAVAAYEYLIWGYPCWKTVLELLGSTTVRGTKTDYWLTMQQLLTAFNRNKFNEK
jgi:predicted membrane-bound mannosyltransferase